MILCESAKQSINLCYSVIKFLEYKGFTWSGDSMPFKISSLGDLMQGKLEVCEQNGPKLEQARWVNGQLSGPFQNDRLYDLSLRLEYGLPVLAEEFISDFESICPKSYEVAVDFLSSGAPLATNRARVRLSDKYWDLDTDKPTEMTLETGQKITVFCEREFRGVVVTASSPIPYHHKEFPALTLLQPGESAPQISGASRQIS